MLLEKGTVLYSKSAYAIRRVVVDRVTAKQAVVKINERSEIRFDRDVGDGRFIYPKGKYDSWNRTSYKVETQELKDEYELFYLREKFSRLKADKLDKDQLTAIFKITS